ncbi:MULTISPECIES: TetR/AcrR family transcriptional regulator [Mesobacillus]|uniref:HTH tetR-type domain-containing protein n=2 Tax=Mesobacillus TaxID=2675231 RepID=A0A0D6ZGU6_9BACI|nr:MULTISPECIES: TetR/AcrR family transcriptional regulator [Mesobacillus]KIY23868.1 hypothetical protein UB32_00615 [Mesobacillus subterraneus]MDQ0415492.1 AcrR family transcriptional regulator [Mesobacillus stamsii]
MRNYKEVTRERIIDEAAALFFEKGYKNTSLETVAKQLEITRPAIYHYFKNKEEIITAIIREVLKKVTAYSEKVLNQNIKPSEKFEQMVIQHLLLILKNKIFVGIFFEEQKSLPEQATKETIKLIDEYYKTCTDLYKKAMEGGCFIQTDPSIAVQTILGACSWSYKWYSQAGSMAAEEMAKTMSVILMRGYRV